MIGSMKTIIFLFLGFFLQAQNLGEVVDKESYEYGGNIYTKNYIQVGSEIKRIKTLGGILGNKAETVSHSPQLYIGQRGYFIEENGFLKTILGESIETQLQATLSTNTATAGTFQNIKIFGSNFGEKNKLSFANADFGGVQLNVDDINIIGWTDSEIEVRVPSWAGTGPVIVRTLENGNFETDILNIRYAITNFTYQDVVYSPAPVDINESGGYTRRISSSMSEIQRELVVNSIDSWRCETGVNWEIGEDIDSQAITSDGISIITMSVSGTLPTSVLGRCTTRYSGCTTDSGLTWVAVEYDIVINSDIVLDYTNSDGPGFHYESVVLHELGHSQGLGHTIDQSDTMHYASSVSDMRTDLNQNNIDGGEYYVSLSGLFCGNSSMIEYSCESLNSNQYQIGDLIYENPVEDFILIDVNYSKIQVFDMLGAEKGNSNKVKHLPKGFYIFIVWIDGQPIPGKFIKL